MEKWHRASKKNKNSYPNKSRQTYWIAIFSYIFFCNESTAAATNVFCAKT